MINQPIAVYNNWSAYDELSDNVELTEELAVKEFDEILRLRKHGVRIDYYLMDAFWSDPDGGYRTWRKPHWPDGPDRWLAACRENDLIPGLWFSGNTLCKLNAAPEWQDSLDWEIGAMCMFKGGFLSDFVDVLQYWYDRGVRAYKLDFFHFGAAPADVRKTHTPDEVYRLNQEALSSALRLFRHRNPDAVFLGYNGLGGEQTATRESFNKNVDTRWLEAFDSLYCGDPRPSNVPTMDFWRSMDIYSDHMVRAYEANDLPLERIDNTSFMIGQTGTCCKRGKAAWKGMLLLSLARGGWVNIYYGNLELLDDEDARWFGKVQSMFLDLQALGRIYTFSGIPGDMVPYGYAAIGQTGCLYTVVNPSQSVQEIEMPVVSDRQHPVSGGRLLFRDAGFEPKLQGNKITLGSEQMALVGFGAYADARYDLGVQEDVVIPADIHPLDVHFEADGKNAVSAETTPPRGKDVRIVMRRLDGSGNPNRVSGGAPPDGTPMDEILRITAEQGGERLPVRVTYDKALWAGLSWAVGEIAQDDLASDGLVRIRCESGTDDEVRLECSVYAVHYRP